MDFICNASEVVYIVIGVRFRINIYQYVFVVFLCLFCIVDEF